MSRGANAVDPKEVLVYTVLHKLGLGPKTHFFWEDQRNFYIATEDLNDSGQFKEYSKIYIGLPDPNKCIDLSSEYLHICEELTKMDVMSRILRISDTTTNKENFGFIEKSGSLFLQLIDFDVKDDYNYTGEGLFEGFLAGNGTYTYSSNTDPTIRFALGKRNVEERLKIAANFLKTFDIQGAVESSMKNALDISQRLNIDLEDLENYYKGINSNIILFNKGLGF